MKVGICTDRVEESWTYQISGEIFFSPLFEMFAAMHVICNPSHHSARLRWWERIQEELEAEEIMEIRALADCTDEWFAPMDFTFVEPFEKIRDMDIPEALSTLEGYSIQRWKKVFANNGKNVSEGQKRKILEVSRHFYENYFYQEIRILEHLMHSALKKILHSWEEEGIAKSLSTVHERLKLNEKELIFYKNKEYHFPYEELEKIYFTASVFLSPHLIMGYDHHCLILVKHFYPEKVSAIPPEELVSLYKGLADGTRLQILRSLKHHPDTTQHLAKKLGISEAAVSKQLKVLCRGGLLKKERKGNFMVYTVEEEALDFLTYRIYEYLL